MTPTEYLTKMRDDAEYLDKISQQKWRWHVKNAEYVEQLQPHLNNCSPAIIAAMAKFCAAYGHMRETPNYAPLMPRVERANQAWDELQSTIQKESTT